MEPQTATPPEPEEWVPVPCPQAEAPLTERRARLWALVLHARSIPGRLEADDQGCRLLVPPDLLEEAARQVRLYEEENRGWPPVAPLPGPTVENTLATASILLLLATFHNIVHTRDPFPNLSTPDWIEIGSAQAGKILQGEPWRLITALTLHSDAVHLAGNLGIGGIFIWLLCRELGSGLGWSLLILSGSLGNLVNAFFHHPGHTSIGLSTAVFGAVGILAALNLAPDHRRLPRRWLLPVAAALALLTALGTEGERVDLGAHLFGFAYGTAVGMITGWLMDRYGRPGRWLNGVLGVLAAAIVVAAWWVAVARG